jgi:hypothetical protein
VRRPNVPGTQSYTRAAKLRPGRDEVFLRIALFARRDGTMLAVTDTPRSRARW